MFRSFRRKFANKTFYDLTTSLEKSKEEVTFDSIPTPRVNLPDQNGSDSGTYSIDDAITLTGLADIIRQINI